MGEISTVLFDMGGVLTPDPMETTLFHERGLCSQFGLDRAVVEPQLLDVWNKYATIPEASPADFWADICAVAGADFTHELAMEVADNVVEVNPEAEPLLLALWAYDIKAGLITNNNSFFYDFQMELLRIEDYLEPELIFSSHTVGASKSKGMLAHAAQVVNPAETLVVEDRQGNITAAQVLGFRTVYYLMSDGNSLFDTVMEEIEST